MSFDYKIAILLPTRGRTEMLATSLTSLIDNASDTASFEIMLGFDDDDVIGREHFTNEIQPLLDEKDIAYTAIEFPRLGYARLNQYVNHLANHSSADWLVFWNDDAIMKTQGWDDVISSHTGEFKLLAFHTHNDHPYSIFPIVPHKWLELFGRLSPHQISDAWLSQVAYLANIWERIPVDVEHDRHDLTGNNFDITFQQRVMLEGNPKDPRDFHHDSWAYLRIDDAQKIVEYLESTGHVSTWWEDVKSHKQDPWEKLKQNDPNDQMKTWPNVEEYANESKQSS
jgi:hypothetical protein